ncbi:hypothetical protein LCGC14_0735980 [marine sediment metagenome]|uniref:Uncharacterized protein n=1 Tax=marine sediment metagenome TaxID=412755 RepID=A0A0F9ST05_9ZZZZ
MSVARKFTTKALSQLIRDRTNDGQELVDFVYSIATGKKMGAGAKAINADLGLRMTAVAWLADRGWGKAAQVIDLEISPSTSPEELQGYTVADLEAMKTAIQAQEKANVIGSSPSE